jgi:hypothetical protein
MALNSLLSLFQKNGMASGKRILWSCFGGLWTNCLLNFGNALYRKLGAKGNACSDVQQSGQAWCPLCAVGLLSLLGSVWDQHERVCFLAACKFAPRVCAWLPKFQGLVQILFTPMAGKCCWQCVNAEDGGLQTI